MENTTKALLIAAVILITIVIISIGILLIKNVSNTSDNASKVGQEISNATSKSTIEIFGGLKGIKVSKKNFNNAFENTKFGTKSEIDERILSQKELLKDQIELVGWMYNDNYINLSKDKELASLNKLALKERGKAVLEWCAKNQDKMSKINNPLDNENIKELCKKNYEEKTEKLNSCYSFEEYCEKFKEKNNGKSPMRFLYFWTYDETEYIDKVYFITGVIYNENIAIKK